MNTNQKKEIIENEYQSFCVKFKIVKKFIQNNFGSDVLIKKNSGIIENKQINISDTEINGYTFHGTGCDFYFEKDTIDIEFHKDNIGFTEWSFYLFSKRKNKDITESEINHFLVNKVEKRELYFFEKIYIPTYQSVSTL
ncbi:hypothetical protein [uncultured Chryseobacterium sp.]|uniref:DUF6896 domain-containing protein n=1 Tax=uncultured Chryseobacterium sp. TaxID=259322 RepID=UPI00258E5883|nr:hypothetical protein [uncultured Chryseobacterium sp.]